jgi:ABC-type Zn2+ transport system substrate-binding protein/surface adhesin
MSPRLAQLIAQMPTMRTDLMAHEAAIQEMYALFEKQWRNISEELQIEIEDLHGAYLSARDDFDEEQRREDYHDALGDREALDRAWHNHNRQI